MTHVKARIPRNARARSRRIARDVEFLRSRSAVASNILNDRNLFHALLRRSVTRRNPLLTFARRFDP